MKTGRTVDYSQYTSNTAHSGAVVDSSRGTNCLPDYRHDIPDFGGEIPSGTPNIGGCQLATAQYRART